METANPTSSLLALSKAPMICPPIFSLTTNMRSGTTSTSAKFQTSFCSATHAWNSSIPRHLRIVIRSTPGAASITSCSPPGFWLVATGFPSPPDWCLPASCLGRATVLPASQSAAGIYGWSCAEQIRDLRQGTAQYLPEQRTNRQLHLPGAPAALPGSLSDWPAAELLAATAECAPEVPASLRRASQRAPQFQASQNPHVRPWS